MNLGLQRIREGMPISNRLLREIHGVLLSKGRGSRKDPGEFRRSQNWVGGTRPGNARFVPPPPDKVADCMGDLEKYIHEKNKPLPLLIRAALAHVQFETIHPFLDGNGRLGRLLITLMLQADGALREPVLYLSLFLKTHRDMYYELLQKVRKNGDWEAWLEFFLIGVQETSDQAAETAKSILELFEADRLAIESLGRPAGSALQVHQYVQSKPLISVAEAKIPMAISAPTIRKSIDHLVDLGILVEMTGKRRDRVFVYEKYVATLSQGTEPIGSEVH
jgi:Fic family protein